MPNNSPGDGSIYQRKDGRWQASLQVNGKRRTVYAKTKTEAAKKLAQLRGQAASGALPDPGRRTVNDLLDLWLETGAPNWKPRTLVNYRWFADTHVRPALGHVRLSRLEPGSLQSLYAKLQADSPSVADRVHRMLHCACKLAALWGWLPANPCERVVPPRYKAERKELWTAEELAAFLAGTQEHWLGPLWLLAVCSGCRIGELLALTWQDVDLSSGTVTINKAGQHIKGQWVVTTPKTKSGMRTVTLPPEGKAALKRQRVQQNQWRLKAGPDWTDTALVFSQRNGQPLHTSVAAHLLKKQCQRLGLPPLTPHGLRHLHASLLLREGLPLPEVSRRLGHANSAITGAIYAHAIGNDDTRAARAISKALAGGAF